MPSSFGCSISFVFPYYGRGVKGTKQKYSDVTLYLQIEQRLLSLL